MTLKIQKHFYRAECSAEDIFTALDEAVEVLEGQIRKHKTRIEKKIHDYAYMKEYLQAEAPMPAETYEESEIPGFNPKAGTGTFGFTDPAGKRIVVDPRQSAAEHASTLAHELAHVHCGHVSDLQEYSRHRGRMETEAEMTAYLVNRSRGMAAKDADSFSPGYIAGWSQGDPKVMHSAMDTAVRAYNKIMEGTWPEGSKTT